MKHRCLAIGDIHEPVSRKGYLQFCKDMYRKWKCDTVVFLGDIVDWSAISFHLRNPEGPGPAEEYRLAFEAIHRWYKAFPKAMVCIGNHDARPHRVAESVNIPAKFLRDYADLWKTPGWKWDHHFIIDDVYYFHGRGCGGIHPAWNAMQTKQRSVVMGHIHSAAGIKWMANVDRRTFGMDVGCGIDDKAYAFVYAAEQLKRSILGCGVVANGIPYHEVMPCSKGELYFDGNFK
jgi:metallophosphoesterase superfamily enzyme